MVLPRFKNDAAEKRFWDKIDLADYFESDDFQTVTFPNLKPTSQTISICLPKPLLLRLKEQPDVKRVILLKVLKGLDRYT